MPDVNPALTRRSILAAAGSTVLSGLTSRLHPAHADTASVQEAIKKRLGDRPLQQGRITLELPLIAQDGNTVPLSISVESPMTPEDYVEAVYVLAEKNPWPEVMTFHFTPRSGKAEASARIRLAMTQNVIAVAHMSNGSADMTETFVKVLIAGCSA